MRVWSVFRCFGILDQLCDYRRLFNKDLAPYRIAGLVEPVIEDEGCIYSFWESNAGRPTGNQPHIRNRAVVLD